MDTLLGLTMITGYLIATIKMFGGLQDTPKWLDIFCGAMLILTFISLMYWIGVSE
jgi:uncharacterized membrane protein YhdT